MSPAEPKPPSWPASKGWYDTLVSGVGALDALPTGLDKLTTTPGHRWIGWRLRGLVLAALLGCLLLAGLARALSSSPWIDANWGTDDRGRVVLLDSTRPELKPVIGQVLVAVRSADGRELPVTSSTLLQRAPRWIVDTATRQRLIEAHRTLNATLAQEQASLVFGNGVQARVPFDDRGFAGLGWAFWPMSVLALVVAMFGVVLWLARPDVRNALYLLITLCQSANLMYVALQTMPSLPLPAVVMDSDLPVRQTLDLVSAAVVVHIFTLHPVRLVFGPLIAGSAWLLALVPAGYLMAQPSGAPWWLGQGCVLAIGVIALGVLRRSQHVATSAFAATMERLGWIVVGSLLLLLLSLVVAHETVRSGRVAEVGSAIWTVFFSSILLLVPFLTRSRQLVREFALLAGVSTVATSLDLLFISVFSLGQFASVALAIFVSLGIYSMAREWIIKNLNGSQTLTLDRIFERMYRTGREIETEPERRQELMQVFLRDLYEPLDIRLVERNQLRSRVAADGSALLIPAPRDGHTDFDGAATQAHTWVLRHAQRGKRLFTAEDARLADRVSEQLRRLVVYDKAVERGRNEERRRIAQDLHDDIGARLLTLMYKAQTPELEDYLRHTLQDLKTLTRGLAASDHLLSHAVAEWKSDIGQRVSAAQIGLHWSFNYDRDLQLTIVQWSSLTRILRELVTNAIAHARATRIEIEATVLNGTLSLRIADNGTGTDPSVWSHGLGLGGVRKRVKALGGVVRWRENTPRGIVCEVQIARLDQPPPMTPPGMPPRRDETRY